MTRARGVKHLEALRRQIQLDNTVTTYCGRVGKANKRAIKVQVDLMQAAVAVEDDVRVASMPFQRNVNIGLHEADA